MTDKKPKPRTGATTWKKGQSGNPGGRSPRVGPDGQTVAQLAREHTAEAVATLRDIMLAATNDPRDRISAALALLDRGWGKPKESVDLDAKIEGGGVPVIQIVRYDQPQD